MDRQRKRLKYQRGPVNEKTTNDDVVGVNVEMDRISNLPPEILCHILSFLPTKYAVATCVLSTQWKNLFPQIPKLRLYLDDSLHCLRKSPSDMSPVKFRRFVNKLFSVNLPQVRSIHSLCLYCQEYDGGSHIANWVRVALGRGAKNIEIKIYHIDNSNFLLHYLFGCKITSLSLSIDFDDEELEGKISLPNLKKLSVEGMNFMHVKAIVDGCPVVEHLLIDRCFTYARREFFIHIPSLKVLKFPDTDYLEPQVELDCPELEILNFSGSSGCRYFREELRSLRIAHLDTISRYPCLVYNRTVELLGVCSFVEKIYLSEMFIMALHNSARPLPYFHYLISLTIESMNSAAHDILPVMLECTPNLQDLIIEKGFDMESFEKLKTSLWRSWNFFICPQNDKRCLIVKIERYVDERYSSVTDKRYFFLTYNC